MTPEHLAKLRAGRAARQQAIVDGTAEASRPCGVCGAEACYAFSDKFRCTDCAQRIFDARDAGHPPGSRIMQDVTILPPTLETLAAVRNQNVRMAPAPAQRRCLCNEPIESKRVGAKFCSNRCAQRACRSKPPVDGQTEERRRSVGL